MNPELSHLIHLLELTCHARTRIVRTGRRHYDVHVDGQPPHDVSGIAGAIAYLEGFLIGWHWYGTDSTPRRTP